MASNNIQDQGSTLTQPVTPAAGQGGYIAPAQEPEDHEQSPQPQGNNDFANCTYRNRSTLSPGRDPKTGRYVLSQAASAAIRASKARRGIVGGDQTDVLQENAGSTAPPTIGISVVENDVDVTRLTSTPHETAGAIEILPPGAGKPGRTNSTAFGSGQERPNGHRPLRYPKRDTLLGTMEQYVTEEDWQRIVETAVERAAMGDKDARKWLSDWLMGPVPKEVSVQVAHQINYDLPTRDIRQLPEEGKEGG